MVDPVAATAEQRQPEVLLERPLLIEQIRLFDVRRDVDALFAVVDIFII